MGTEQKGDVNGEEHMKFYEDGRLYPYRDSKPGYYSNADLRNAYLAWANAVPGNRKLEWDYWCDARDGYAPGTNAAIRQKLEKQQTGHNEPRRILK